jgi:uncharacterized SAM-binding protein YcdF (DUF218 family)
MSRRPRFRHTAGPRSAFIRAVAVVALAAGLWLGGLAWFAESLPRTVRGNQTPTDGIVVFTGGPERLEAALALLAADTSRKLFVSGVSAGVSGADIQAASQRAPELFECCVVLGYEAMDTAGNARETAAWVAAEGYTSLRVVTAAYHMPRSLVELASAMPEVTLVAHPVFPERVRLDAWWSWPGTASLVATEYTKYLVSRLRAGF